MKKSKKFEYLEPWNMPTIKELKQAQEAIINIMEELDIIGNYDLSYMHDGGPCDFILNVYTQLEDYIATDKFTTQITEKLDKIFDFNPKGLGKFHVMTCVRNKQESSKYYKDRIDF